MNVSSRSLKVWTVLAAVAFAVTLSSWSYAVVVETNGGTWNVTIGNTAFSGDITIDPKTGDISIPEGFQLTDPTTGAALSLSSFTGNADPTIGFGLVGITGANPASFSATFSIPVSLSGPVLAQSNASYTLTRLGTGSATLSPFNAFTVTAQDKVSATGEKVNKGGSTLATPLP
jgi:hypothetical protein